jgi:hypothetical protein
MHGDKHVSRRALTANLPRFRLCYVRSISLNHRRGKPNIRVCFYIKHRVPFEHLRLHTMSGKELQDL